MDKWRQYLEGCQCVVFTDHQALTWLWKNSQTKGRLMRWVLRLQNFDFQIMYRKGCDHSVPDALSRAPTSPAMIASVEVTYDLNQCHAENCTGDQDDSAYIEWVQCDDCPKWYHLKCVNLSMKEAQASSFSCHHCLSHSDHSRSLRMMRIILERNMTDASSSLVIKNWQMLNFQTQNWAL